ncbi:LxmA leader domain family RiPP [Streptomyces sp. NPDC052036]|uniref:LxmA leader domain family RiPP n=1 Tax=unclassified Streptomyces TaxID=2593676 RepID=UPI003419925E
MSTTAQLMAGYAAYTDAAEFGASAEGNVPATAETTITIFSTQHCATSITLTTVTHQQGC